MEIFQPHILQQENNYDFLYSKKKKLRIVF